MKISLEDIKGAKRTLENVIFPTKLVESKKISSLSNNRVFLKCENLQKTGSFKIRGAYNKIASLSEEQKANGVIASSAGNHAQGVALGATAYGIKSTIVMPAGAPVAKVMATQGYGAEVVLHGNVYDEAYEKAVNIQKETGATFLHPFDDPYVIAGQGTIGLEIMEDLEDVDVIVVPIGGGGLIAGIAVAAKSINPKVKIIGVEPETAASMKTSVEKDQKSTLDTANSIADGIAVKTPGDLTYSIVKEYVDEIITVSEDDIAKAILTLMENEKLIVEGAGAASVAALISGKINSVDKKVAAVISGGNIDMNMVCSIIENGLLKSGRKTEIKVTIPDKPGNLQSLLELIASTKANISSIYQTKMKSYVNIGAQEVTMLLDTKNHGHIQEIHEVLIKSGYNIIKD
ncbi:threonine ammonia-lyase [Irregularibacter muris]|uniref:L-threonine dehydratase catabolic TdcB n=1 Tax=Irregularibacter muris TaxID=1796619 RepID=A0AAE3HK58_9FIRM|nr:threonine ammonia-lyase [Irregularibacter muris]MCR1900233.1 threonine ammonia-lyase [Irregularibacter muris]